MALFDPRFRDIAERETKARDRLSFRKNQLDKKEADGTALTVEEQKERDRIAAILKAVNSSKKLKETAQPVVVATRDAMQEDDCKRKHTFVTHDDGHLVFAETDPAANSSTSASDETIVQTALTLGLLAADEADAPRVHVVDNAATGTPVVRSDRSDPLWARFNRAFYEALGEARSMADLGILVLPILSIEGDPDGRGGAVPQVNAVEFAEVMRELVRRGVTANEYQLRRRVNEALNKLQRRGEGGPLDDIGIVPPDLGEVSGTTVERENVLLMGPMIVAAMMDEVKAFQTLDHIVQRFQDATLVRFSQDAGQKLYRWWREAPNRMSEMERRTFYAITLGIPGGEPSNFVNRGFNDLFLRFVSSVSDTIRSLEHEHHGLSAIYLTSHQQQCRKAARDLVENLSLHGYGMAQFAAKELSVQVNEVIDILSDEDIRANFGARDMWQVIDQVASLELGGAKSTSRYRTLATCGTIITAWLGNNIKLIMSPTGPLIDLNEVRHPQPRAPGEKAITHPNDYDLVNACELWLADSAISDSRVEELSQPMESPTQTSRPIQVPSIAQDMLGDLGIGLAR
ncbi:MAG: hypothetical protein KJN93_08235 [Alphaproteobacteria bacterium]|nr:hypothetical protein [Alphaproteobacteria bacterium]